MPYMRTIKSALLLLSVFLVGLTCLVANPAHADSNAVVLLTWTSDTYTPISYQSYARTLPVWGATMTFFATPFTTQAGTGKNAAKIYYTPQDPQSFYYVWYINGTKYDQSQGESSLTYSIDPYVAQDSIDVHVQIFDAASGTLVAEQQEHIPLIQQPQVLLYSVVGEKTLPDALQAFSGAQGSTLTIAAKPFFFNVPQKNQILFTWYHNGNALPVTDNDPYSFQITLPNQKAQNQFTVTLMNSLYKLQYITSSFTVQAQ